jgi:hypothetical protein
MPQRQPAGLSSRSVLRTRVARDISEDGGRANRPYRGFSGATIVIHHSRQQHVILPAAVDQKVTPRIAFADESGFFEKP